MTNDPTQRIELTKPTLAYLIQTTGSRRGHAFQLKPETTTVGYGGDSDVRLDDRTVSSAHAKVRVEAGDFVLYDLASTNGTTVNGETVVRHELRHDDEIKFGEIALVFKRL